MKVLGRSALLGLVAFLVLGLALFGVLDDLPPWVRGAAQGLGVLAGVVLGAALQTRDNRASAESAAKTSIVHLGALARVVHAHLESLDRTALRMQDAPPQTVAACREAIEGILASSDSHGRGVLAQAQAAAAAWYPFVAHDEEFLSETNRNVVDQP